MSDVGLGATLQLDIQDALARIDTLGQQAEQALSNIPTSLAEPDASPITLAIDQAVEAANTSVTPEAEADGVTAAIDAAVAAVDGTIPVDADTSAAAAAVEQVAADAEATDATITVTADTSQADADLAAVGETAAGAAGGVDDLNESTAELSGTQSAAQESAAGLTNGISALANVNTATTGSTRGLGAALGALGPGGQTAALGIGAVVGLLGSFVGPALAAQQSATRFTNAVGEFEPAIRNVQVGSLNGDLADLAARLGTSDEALQDAATSIFTLGTRSGVAAPKVAQTTEQILAISLAARAANPRLGESGEIAERLAVAFAKGGKALSPYNIAITQNEILLRAQNDSGGKAVDQLTQYEKAAAGAAIASERYGDSLGEMFAKGENDPAIRLAAIKNSFGELSEELGKPIIAPAIEALEALAPLGLGIVTLLGDVAQALVPILDLIASAAPIFEAFGGAMSALDPGIVGLVAGLAALAAGAGAFFTAFTAGIAVANPILAGFLATAGLFVAVTSALRIGDEGPESVSKFTKAVAAATDALTDQAGQISISDAALGTYLKNVSAFSTDEAQADLARFGLTAEELTRFFTKDGIQGFADFGNHLVSMSDGSDEADEAIGRLTNVMLGATGQVEALAYSTLKAGVKNGIYAQSFLDTAKTAGGAVTQLRAAQAAEDQQAASALDAAVAAGTLGAAQRDALLRATEAADGTNDYSAALKLYEDQVVASAEAQARFAESFGSVADRLPDVAQMYLHLGDGIGSIGFDLGQLAVALGGAGVSAEDFAIIAAGMGVPVEALQGFVKDTGVAIDEFVSGAVEKIPGVGAAFDSARQRAEEAERALTGKDILAGLNESLAAITSYGANLEIILGSAYADLAGFAAQAGPDAVAAIADSITDKDGKTLDALRTNFETAIPQGLQHAADLLETASVPFLDKSGVVAQLATAYFGANFTPAQLAQVEMALATNAITDAVPGVTAAGAEAGAAGGESVGESFSGGFSGALGRGKTEVSEAAKAQAAATKVIAAVEALVSGNSVGSSFSAGTAAGIGSTESIRKIRNAAAQSVREAESAARAEARSQSPSKLFADLGRDLGTGIAQGIDQSGVDVVAAAEQIIRDAAGVIDNGSLGRVAVGSRASEFAVAAGVAAGGTSSSASIVVQDGAVRVSLAINGDISDQRASELGIQIGDGIAARMAALTDRAVAADAAAAGL